MQPILLEKREEIAELCRRHHVERLDVFGSAVRDDFDPEKSDFDFLVVWHQGHIYNTFANLLDLEEAMVRLLGRPVDLITARTIRNPYLRESIEEDLVPLYAA